MGTITRVGFAVLFAGLTVWAVAFAAPDIVTAVIAYWLGAGGCATISVGFLVDAATRD